MYDKLPDKSGTESTVRMITQYDDFRRAIDDIMSVVSNMNTLNAETHKETKFAALIGSIEQLIKAETNN
ncbi:MAG: hypothetical protein JWQ38_565, partial [Flavipsychrobacter sp.]|nr:hypothetical protein [Flavipsychrobacter sp.]